MENKQTNSGFSLVELMVVIGLMAIIMAIGTPVLMEWLPTYRLKGASEDLVGNLNKAKMEAIKRNRLCVVLFDEDSDEFDYMLFIDDDADLIHDNDETVVTRVRFEDYKSVSLKDPGFTDNDDGNPAIAFRPNGLLMDNDGPLEYRNIANFTVTLENTKGTERNIIVSKVGNARIDI